MELSSQIFITKANGDREPFDRDKMIRALKNSGVSDEECNRIVGEVEKRLYDGITSRKIYQMAYGLLKKRKSYREAGRYRLKKAIFDLGPSGFPFEKFVGRLFEYFGYEVKTGQVIQGKCVQHEVDVVAIKPGEQVIVECKFHHDYRGKTNVQVPLYIHSRFKDIKEKWSLDEKYKHLNVRGYVVTNSRFTLDAIQYAECAGLEVISWDYPKNGSLKYFIDKSGFHPVTSLRSLNKSQKKLILEEGIVLCRELINQPDIMRKLGLSEQTVSKVIKEAELMAH
ncbi:MAG: ATPase [Chlorobi bacterium]|nr:ATPase [Chlorobiota bacterium]